MEKNQRWWEFYLVRYFVGTVVGTIIVLILVFTEGSTIKETIKGISALEISINNFQMAHLWLYGFLGLAYCYIASGPILLFHAIRGWIFPKDKSDRSIYGYYKQLAEDRAKREKNDEIKEYVESYKHLREHGNAFFIVLMEIFLGILLFFSSKVLILILILSWVIAATFVWFIGTYLERKLNDFSKGKVINEKKS